MGFQLGEGLLAWEYVNVLKLYVTSAAGSLGLNLINIKNYLLSSIVLRYMAIPQLLLLCFLLLLLIKSSVSFIISEWLFFC